MMRWIVGSSLRFRYLVIAAAGAMVLYGAGQLRDSPVDVFPEFAPPIVELQTPALGLSPSEVEALVTIPLEQALAGVPGMDVLRSKSVPQLSSVKMIFEPGTDLLEARQLVQERVQVVVPNLPSWASPPVMLPPLSATSRSMKIGISSDSLSVIDLSMIGYWTIRQRLLQVPGVANVAMWGERLEMLQVQVVPERMQQYDVTLDEIMQATADALDVGLFQFSDGHFVGTGGWIDTPNQRLPVRHVLPLVYRSDDVDPDRLANVTVTVRNGEPVLISDVAEVVVDHQPMVGDGIINDGPGLLLIVEKFPWGNTLELTRDVEAALDALRPGLPNVEIDSEIFRPATFIEVAIDNLTKALVIAALLVVLVLFLFLYEWRVALISCTAIPLSLLSGILVLSLRGTTINTMVLAGAILPVFVMEGLSGAFFRPLAFSYALAVAASTVVALTVTPALSYILLRNVPVEKRESPLVRWLHGIYDRILAGIVRSPRPAYATVGVIALAGVVVVPQLGQSLLPDFKERDFLMHWLTKPGTSWPEMNRITIQASKELRQIPGVRNFGAHIGQALIMDEVVGMYFGENWISVDPSVDYDETVETIQATVDGYPGLFRDVLTYLKERIREVLTGTSEAIVVRIYGEDLDLLSEKGSEVREALEGIEGIIDLHVELHENIPQIEVEVDLERAQQYGLKPGDVRRAATTMIAGEEAGDIHIAHRTYDVQVWTTPQNRNSLTDVREMPINTPGGGTVQLQEVADVRIAPTPNVIEHENLKRRLDVGANVRGRDLGSVYRDVRTALAGVDFPQGFYPELLGEYTERLAVQRKLLFFAIISMIAVFLLLQTSFGSARLATLSFILLPAALVGGALAAYLGDGVLSLGSLVGFLTVLGIAARNGILMINHFQHLEEFEGETFGVALVLRGARERLAPILMTAMTTGLALTPLVFVGPIPGNEIEHPMAVVILGGLVTATLINLFVVPPLYLKFGKGQGALQPVVAAEG
ncbi:MAG: efflux RND transporter permease subunit [Gemmatimonadota bacterium]